MKLPTTGWWQWLRFLPGLTPPQPLLAQRQATPRWQAAAVVATLSLLTTSIAEAKIDNLPFAQSTTTYTPILGGAPLSFGGITTTWYNNVTALTPGAGFSFNFNGKTYSSFFVNSNGYITFGPIAPSPTTFSTISLNEGYDGAIAALATPLINNGAAITWTLQGVAPKRTLIIQWNNARRYFGGAVTGDVINFQIRLNETTNSIQLIYGNTSLSAAIPERSAQVGLRGASSVDFHDRKGSNWLSTTKGTLNYDQVSLGNTSMPANGLTFTYAGSPVNDHATGATAGSFFDIVPDPTGAQPKFWGTTVNATGPYMSSSAGNNADDDVWYTFVAGSTTVTITVEPEASTFAANIETFATQPAAGATATALNLTSGRPGTMVLAGLTNLTVDKRYWFRVFSNGTTERAGFLLKVRQCISGPAGTVHLGNTATTCYNRNGTTIGAATSGVTTTCAGTPNNDVWYSFTVASPMTTVKVSVAASSSGFAPALEILGSYDGYGSLGSYACTATPTPGGAIGVVFNPHYPGVYYARVYGGQGLFTVCAQTLADPATVFNDFAHDARDGEPIYNLGVSTNCLPTTQGTTIGATGPDVYSGMDGAEDDVWYGFFATTPNTNITVSPSEPTFRTVIETFATEPAPGAVTSAMHLALGNPGTPLTANLTGLTVGQYYFFRVFGRGTVRSNFTVCVQELGTPRPSPQPTAANNTNARNATADRPDLSSAQLAVWPNPVPGKAALQLQLRDLPATDQTLTTQLVDALGRVVATQPLAPVNGQAEASFDTHHLHSSVYLLKIASDEQIVTRRIVIE